MQLLTERVVEAPRSWYATSTVNKCNACVYQDFYIKHESFVSEYASGSDLRENRKLPMRRMISIEGKD
jgi:hypothetical protein